MRCEGGWEKEIQEGGGERREDTGCFAPVRNCSGRL